MCWLFFAPSAVKPVFILIEPVWGPGRLTPKACISRLGALLTGSYVGLAKERHEQEIGGQGKRQAALLLPRSFTSSPFLTAAESF